MTLLNQLINLYVLVNNFEYLITQILAQMKSLLVLFQVLAPFTTNMSFDMYIKEIEPFVLYYLSKLKFNLILNQIFMNTFNYSF